MTKNEQIKNHLNRIPKILDEFKLFLNSSEFRIDELEFSENEIYQIEKIIRKYFSGQERLFLDIDDYKPLFKAPAYKIYDAVIEGFSTYLGEFVRKYTDADWTLHTGKVISSNKFAIVFKKEKFNKTIIDFVPDFIIDSILRSKLDTNVYEALDYVIKEAKQ